VVLVVDPVVAVVDETVVLLDSVVLLVDATVVVVVAVVVVLDPPVVVVVLAAVVLVVDDDTTVTVVVVVTVLVVAVELVCEVVVAVDVDTLVVEELVTVGLVVVVAVVDVVVVLELGGAAMAITRSARIVFATKLPLMRVPWVRRSPAFGAHRVAFTRERREKCTSRPLANSFTSAGPMPAPFAGPTVVPLPKVTSPLTCTRAAAAKSRSAARPSSRLQNT
jgi:hypothetical protein